MLSSVIWANGICRMATGNNISHFFRKLITTSNPLSAGFSVEKNDKSIFLRCFRFTIS